MFCVDNIIPGWYSRARTKKQASRNEFPIDPITIRRLAETIGGENDRNKIFRKRRVQSDGHCKVTPNKFQLIQEREGTVRWTLRSNTEQSVEQIYRKKVQSDGSCRVTTKTV